MWICITKNRPAPIRAQASTNGISPRRKAGSLSWNPRKKQMPPGSTYDTLMTWVEKFSVHGSVMSDAQITQLGTAEKRRHRYQANAASAPNDNMLSRTIGASGAGQIANPQRTNCR